MHMDPEYLSQAFHEGRAGDFELVHHPVGRLFMPSGRLVVCDPFICYEPDPFSLPVPEGDHPVVLVVARDSIDQRVAFARLDLGSGSAVEWDLMTADGQNQAELEPDEIFGYGVDTGTGCFADHETMLEYARLMESASDYGQAIQDELERSYVQTWGWVNWRIANRLNLVAFSSGYGDGLYPTYVALNRSGDLVSILTDFMVLPQTGP